MAHEKLENLVKVGNVNIGDRIRRSVANRSDGSFLRKTLTGQNLDGDPVANPKKRFPR